MKNPALRFAFRCAVLILAVSIPPFINGTRLMAPESPIYETMARTLISGRPVQADLDYLRPLKVAWLLHAPQRKRFLVLGGSRAAAIAADWFPAGDLWNAAVTESSLGDQAAFFEVCVEANRVPDTLILEVFPALARPPGTPDVGTMDPWLERALRRYGMQRPPESPEVNLQTMLELHSTWAELVQAARGKPVPNSQVEPDGRVRFPSFIDSEILSEEGIAANLAAMNSDEIPFRSQSQPDEFATRLFRHFLDDLHSRGVRVIVFMAPLHPIAWEFFRRRGGYDEAWLRRELGGRGIPVVGTYSPFAAHAVSSDFYDSLHPRPALVRRLLAEGGVIPGVIQ